MVPILAPTLQTGHHLDIDLAEKCSLLREKKPTISLRVENVAVAGIVSMACVDDGVFRSGWWFWCGYRQGQGVKIMVVFRSGLCED
ncbi:hypothetical protein P8452_15043 [Trifolium repens]|jgi:hypothetical protein|nr:hypothetical protein QL285_011085 [Trifolium repens]WJX26067.1 hypothetical protein P8452_15043 [Trifolium repens]